MMKFGAILFGALVATAIPAYGALDSKLLAGLKARNVGPASVSGRVTVIDAVTADPNRLVVGTATGGVWTSDNGGLNWTPVFDDQPVASIGALAINQSNPDIIWVGTGESNVRNSTSIGGGVYKSIDGGRSWKLVGLESTERIDRIALDPRDPDVAYVAALGTLWGPNEDRGLYKTVDAGGSWERLLYVDDTTGATDVKLDPHNPDKVYAAMWQFRRWPYHFKSGGAGSGMYLSYDGGQTWQQKTTEDGLPKGELGRMVFAPSPAQKGRVWALVEAEKSAVIRSDDGGESWSTVNTDYNISDRPFYYTELFADPVDANRVYNVSTRVRVSIDGGRTFRFFPAINCCAASNTIHIDNHAFWINPADPRHLITGNDGGLGISRDRGETWRFVRNLPLAQFYHIAVDNDHPYNIYGGLQDNGSWRGPAELWETSGILNFHWREVGFGDGFDTVPDPRNSRTGYSMSQGGNLYRWDLDNGEWRVVRPSPPEEDSDLRFNWSAGFAFDPFDPDTVYYGSQYVHKSTDRGESWTVISGDLTSNNPEFQTFRESGGLTPDVTAAENYTSIVAMAPSPVAQGTLWVGTDDGRIHVTRDGGETWNRVDGRVRGVPAGTWVPMIHPSPHEAGVAHVVFDDHRRSNMATYVYRAENYGQRWRNLSDDSDLRGYAHSVLQDHEDPSLLFLGTEFGLFFSTDSGDEWTPFRAGVPTVSVMDMAIQAREDDLVLGTHGRSVYVVDDYSALRGLEAEDFDQRLRILSTTPGQQYDPNQTPGTRFTGSGEFRAPNEPYGVMITFMASGEDLAHPDKELERDRKIARRDAKIESEETEDNGSKPDKPVKVKLTVTTLDDETVREYRYPVYQGINRITWPLRADGVRRLPGADQGTRPTGGPGRSQDDGLPPGPEVPPGQYRVTLSLDEQEDSAEVTVLPDPRSPYSAEDRLENYRTLLAVRDLRRTAVDAVETILHARDDVDTVIKLIKQRDDEALKELQKEAGEIRKALDDLEKVFRTPPRTKGIVYDDDKVNNLIGGAYFYVASSFDAPSPAARVYIERAEKSLQQGRQQLNEFLQGKLAEFRQKVTEAEIGLLRQSAS